MKQAIIVLKNLPNKERIKRILELRRSNAATPKKSLKIYSRKQKHKNKAE